MVLAALAADRGGHDRLRTRQLRRHRASGTELLALDVALVAPNPARAIPAHATASAIPCRTVTADPGLIPVSYTHLDVYKRQLLGLVVLGVLLTLGPWGLAAFGAAVLVVRRRSLPWVTFTLSLIHI